jgi:hypothetical protein
LSNLVYTSRDYAYNRLYIQKEKERRGIIRAALCMQKNRRPESTSGVLVHPPTPPPDTLSLVLFNPGMI